MNRMVLPMMLTSRKPDRFQWLYCINRKSHNVNIFDVKYFPKLIFYNILMLWPRGGNIYDFAFGRRLILGEESH